MLYLFIELKNDDINQYLIENDSNIQEVISNLEKYC